MPDQRRGLIVAAPQSGSGKTIFTLGLLRALKQKGLALASAKSGPDYIDPKFHEAATGTPCLNLDAWAMAPDAIHTRAAEHTPEAGTLIVEGAMGLFDGSAAGSGSTADLATLLNLPVVLVIDASRQAQSIAALVHGFITWRSDITLAGIILNKIGSARHEHILRQALKPLSVKVFGSLTNDNGLKLPSRHLGLVQAHENPDLEGFIEAAGAKIDAEIDLSGLIDCAGALSSKNTHHAMLPPLGKRTSIAKDIAFSFSYPHLLRDWEKQGCEISFFSPLANEGPRSDCDSVYLPGGYPELWGETLVSACHFRLAMREAAASHLPIYGECGGFMVLGDQLTDASGTAHKMLGLLPLETSFYNRERHLGYRRLRPKNGRPWQQTLNAHEFHYSTLVAQGAVDRMFAAEDAEANRLDEMGLRSGTVCGSYAHIIDVA